MTLQQTAAFIDKIAIWVRKMNEATPRVEDAIQSRKSVRAFLPDPVPREQLEHILRVALRAPSGGNLQPWRLYVLSGAARDRLVAAVREYRKNSPMGDAPEYPVYPPNLNEPYRSRRFLLGEAMYATMNIPREDKAARLAFFAHNWEFFGAPAGMIITMDRQMGVGQWADLGMLLQNIMLLARTHGLHTCPQESWSSFHHVIRRELPIGEHEMVFAGMAIGYADSAHPVNTLYSERAPLEEIVTFIS